MQISRLFEIVYILLGRRHVTARELAERFEVSVRTIYRDIDALSQAGVPVYATQGAGGGIFINEDYVLNKSALTDNEQAHILMALQSLSVTGTEDSDRLLSRLGSMFNKSSSDWIEVDFSRWEDDGKDRKTLSDIKQGILGHHPIAFTYYSGMGVCTARSAYPVKLLYKSRAWYVRAFCLERSDYRTFKLVRMADLKLLAETFDPEALPPAKETPDPEDAPKGPPPHIEPVVIRFQPQIAWRVLDEFDPRIIHWHEDGMLSVRVFFPMDEWLNAYILSFGAAAEVLSPPHMREKIRKALQVLTEKYDDAE